MRASDIVFQRFNDNTATNGDAEYRNVNDGDGQNSNTWGSHLSLSQEAYSGYMEAWGNAALVPSPCCHHGHWADTACVPSPESSQLHKCTCSKHQQGAPWLLLQDTICTFKEKQGSVFLLGLKGPSASAGLLSEPREEQEMSKESLEKKVLTLSLSRERLNKHQTETAWFWWAGVRSINQGEKIFTQKIYDPN